MVETVVVVVVSVDVVDVMVVVVTVPEVVDVETVDEVVLVVVVVLVRHTPHKYGQDNRTSCREHDVAAAEHPSESVPLQTGRGSVSVAVVVVVVVLVVVLVVVVVVVLVVVVDEDGIDSMSTMCPPPHAQHAVDAVWLKLANCGSIPSRAHCCARAYSAQFKPVESRHGLPST